MQAKSLPMVIGQNIDPDGEIRGIMQRCSPHEQEAFIAALQRAHALGEAEAEKRTGRIIAQVLAPLLGVRQPEGNAAPTSLRRAVSSLLRGSLGSV